MTRVENERRRLALRTRAERQSALAAVIHRECDCLDTERCNNYCEHQLCDIDVCHYFPTICFNNILFSDMIQHLI